MERKFRTLVSINWPAIDSKLWFGSIQFWFRFADQQFNNISRNDGVASLILDMDVMIVHASQLDVEVSVSLT